MLAFARVVIAARSATRSVSSQAAFRVVFFGTDYFSLASLQALHKQTLATPGCVSALELCCTPIKVSRTEPDSVVRKYADAQGIPVREWPLKSEDVAQDFDLGIVASFGRMIPSKLISAFPRGIINVHASLLPRWRGAAPIPHAILNGDTETGVSIMEIKPFHFDVGAILASRRHPIGREQTRRELTLELAEIGADLLVHTMQDLDRFQREQVPQSEEEVTYAPVLDKSMLRIAWAEKSAIDIFNQYRALIELGKLHAVWEDTDTPVRFAKMRSPYSLPQEKLDAAVPDAQPGRTIYYRSSDVKCLCTKAKTGWVAFDEFYCASKKVMTQLDFFNGYISRHKGRSLRFV